MKAEAICFLSTKGNSITINSHLDPFQHTVPPPILPYTVFAGQLSIIGDLLASNYTDIQINYQRVFLVQLKILIR